MLRGTTQFKGLFDSIPYHLSPVNRHGYDACFDGHFNDTGHREYAEFLDTLIQHAN